MGDFNVDAVARIVAAINKVNRSIQKTQSYIDANTYSLQAEGVVAVVEVAAACGTLGFITNDVQLAGLIAGTSGTVAHIESLQEFKCLISGISTLAALLNDMSQIAGVIAGLSELVAPINLQTGLEGAVAAGISSISALLDLQTGLKSGATEVAGVGGALAELADMSDLAAASANAVAGADGAMGLIANCMAGIVTGECGTVAHIESLQELVSSAAGQSGTVGVMYA